MLQRIEGRAADELWSEVERLPELPLSRVPLSGIDREIAHPAERDISHPTVPYGSRWMKEEINIVTLFDLGSCCRRQAQSGKGRSPPWENSQELLKPSSQRAKVKNVDCFVILLRPARREQVAHCRKLCRVRIRDYDYEEDYDEVDD